jgi:K+-sensing histidine kinase KdpD
MDKPVLQTTSVPDYRSLLAAVLRGARGYIVSLALAGAVTALIALLSGALDVRHVASIYLVPVLVSAASFGIGPAVASAVAGVAASAYLFYPPIYSFRVDDPEQVVDLVAFIGVAVVTGHLANRLRSQLRISQQRERELQELHRELRVRAETEALREAFIGSVSHELRTPLSSILGAATVLGQVPAVAQDGRSVALVNVVRDEAERLNGDIQNLLDATRISGDGVRPTPEWADPADVINSALERLRRRLSQHRLQLDMPADLPLIYVDPRMLEQALVQVLDNAGKYSPAGTTIRLTARETADAFVLEVTDEGAGLTVEESAHAWDRFYRGTRHVGATLGSGLGLWIARSFVTRLGGEIAARSGGVGRGTTVTLRLPQRREAMPGIDETDG